MTLQTLLFAIGLVVTWSGFLIGVIKWLLDRNLESYNRKIEKLEVEMKELKEDLAALQQELPISYVRRCDFQRCQDECHLNFATIGKKLDDLKMFMVEKLDEIRKEVRYARSE